MKAVNEKEFQSLIEKYDSIGIEELKGYKFPTEPYWESLKLITGFGSTSTCTLCKKVEKVEDYLNCDACVYGVVHGLKDSDHYCCDDDNMPSYDNIYYADTFDLLLEAVKNRAEHMKSVWKQYLKIRTK